MSRVCEKHEEFCPDGVCRWCEPVENIEHLKVGHVCGRRDYDVICGQAAAWEWKGHIGSTPAVRHFCEAHHDENAAMFANWQKERLP